MAWMDVIRYKFCVFFCFQRITLPVHIVEQGTVSP